MTTTKYSSIIPIQDIKHTAEAITQQYGLKTAGKDLALQMTQFKICSFFNAKVQSPEDSSCDTKCSGCSLTVLNTQLQNSNISKFVIQQQSNHIFVNYVAQDSVVNTFLLSLDKPSVDHFTELELLH